jgi:hypothetical protein
MCLVDVVYPTSHVSLSNDKSFIIVKTKNVVILDFVQPMGLPYERH